jgi:N-acetylglucosaminyldiphosphoundecaprenol N-acetyl-beta-D-mannosaminyltransferase
MPPTQPTETTTRVNDIQLSQLDYAQTSDRVLKWALSGEQHYVCICNVHSVTSSKWDPALKQSLQQASLNTTDGMPLVWLLRRLGASAASRVYGPTLMLKLLEKAVPQKARIAFYGGHPERMPKLLENLNKWFPTIQIVATITPPFRPPTEEEDRETTRTLADARPHITFVGIGCPKQENWMRAHKDSIPGVMLGVGAAFDFHAGAVKQAPNWLQRAGLEWAFRLAMEPRRLFKRYTTTNPVFIGIALTQLMAAKIAGKSYHRTRLLPNAKSATPANTQTWAICVATYNRPAMLTKLLESINTADRPENLQLELRIVDNDKEGSARAAVDDFRKVAKDLGKINYTIEPRQNIAHARNAALELGPADAYVFVDDDEFVEKQWLTAFHDSDSRYDADAQFGGLIGILGKDSKRWMTRGRFYDRPAPPTGTPLDWTLTRTGNTLVRGKWLAERKFRFDPNLGRSGGSDSDLFARMEAQGATFCSCAESVVSEFVPANRASFKWLWMRFYRGGLTYEHTLRRTQTGAHPLLRAAKRLIAALALCAQGMPALIKGQPEQCIRGLLKIPLMLGGLKVWLLPSSSTKHVEYNNTTSTRVALLTNIVSPYRKPLYAALGNGSNWDFRLFIDAQSEFDRDWSVETEQLPVEPTRCISWTRTTRTPGPTPFEQKLTLHLPFGLPFQLFKFRPKAIISLELGCRTALAALYAKCSGAKLIIWSYQSRVSSHQSWLRKQWRRLLFKQAATVVGMGKQAREVLTTWGVPDAKIIDAPNAADHQTLSARINTTETQTNALKLKQRYAPTQKLAIVVGRLVPLKGTEHILNAWNRLPDSIRSEWKLVFIGSGPLQKLVEAQDSNQIEWAGSVAPEAMPDWYTSAELHIFPSCGDTWGLVVNEASICGTPSLCSIHAACCDDLIDDGQTGFKIDLSIPEAGDAQLRAALKHPDLAKIGRAAQTAISAYTIDNMANGLRTAVNRALKP